MKEPRRVADMLSTEQVLGNTLVVHVGPDGHGHLRVWIGSERDHAGSMKLNAAELAALLDGPLERALTAINEEGSHLRHLAELAVNAWIPLAPVRGSWGAGYRLSERIDPVLRATVEEWAEAGQAFCDLQSVVAASAPEDPS